MSALLQHYDWKNWLAGLWVAAIGGGANAVVSATALNISDPSHFNAQNHQFFKIIGTLFFSSAAMSFFMYLKQSPLPKVIEEKTTTTTTTTKVEQTTSPEGEPNA